MEEEELGAEASGASMRLCRSCHLKRENGVTNEVPAAPAEQQLDAVVVSRRAAEVKKAVMALVSR